MAPDHLVEVGTYPVEVDLGRIRVVVGVVLAGLDDHERHPGGDGLPDPHRYVVDLSCVVRDDRVLHLHRLEDQELITRRHRVADADRDADDRPGQRCAHGDVQLCCHVLRWLRSAGSVRLWCHSGGIMSLGVYQGALRGALSRATSSTAISPRENRPDWPAAYRCSSYACTSA